MTTYDTRYLKLRRLQGYFASPARRNRITTIGELCIIISLAIAFLSIIRYGTSGNDILLTFSALAGVGSILLLASSVNYELYRKRERTDRNLIYNYFIFDCGRTADATTQVLATEWSVIPLPLDRRYLLINAGLNPPQALTPETCLLTEEDLAIMEALLHG